MADSVKWKLVNVCTKRPKCHQEMIRLLGVVQDALPGCSLPSLAANYKKMVLSLLSFSTLAQVCETCYISVEVSL